MSSARRVAGVTTVRRERRRTRTRARRHVWSPRCSSASCRSRGSPAPPQIARQGKAAPFSPGVSFHGGPRRQGFARAGPAALDRSGPPPGILPVGEKAAADRAPLGGSLHAPAGRARPLDTPRYTRSQACKQRLRRLNKKSARLFFL